MIVLILGLLAAICLLTALRDHRSDDPRRRHPSTGGANKPDPFRQSCHVRIVRDDEAGR